MRARSIVAIAGVAALAAGPAAAEPPTQPAASKLIQTLGLKVAPHPVRERPGWRPPRIILVSDLLHELMPRLRQAAPQAQLIELGAATPAQIAAADAALGVCSAAVLGAARQLQWIQWLGAGVERCTSEPLLHSRAPLLTNLQRTMGPSISEHVIALMFALSRHLDYFYRQQLEAHWAKTDAATPELADLEGRTVLVAGLGGIGTEVARRAHALGMRVTATRASGHEGPDFVSYVGLPNELPKLAHEADFVVNCLPLTPETTGIFNKAFFAAMKPGAYFLSVGRGESTLTADLVAALEQGVIAGAGLDVVDPEPLPADSPLWHAPHLILTPHISSNTTVAAEARDAVVVENLRRYAAGEPMLSVVDIEKGY